MNYATRFAFHIFVPAYIFNLYLYSGKKTHDLVERKLNRITQFWNNPIFWQISLLFLTTMFFIASSERKNQVILTYYQRTLSSHAELGKTIKKISEKYGIKAISVGDAGMIAYHSDVIVLDNIGLASSLVARGIVDDKLFEKYDPSLVILHADKDNMPATCKYHQRELLDWVYKKKFKRLGDIYFQPAKAELIIYSLNDIPELKKVCEESYIKNNYPLGMSKKLSDIDPPWIYWHE